LAVVLADDGAGGYADGIDLLNAYPSGTGVDHGERLGPMFAVGKIPDVAVG
jgi:hypothetical protein